MTRAELAALAPTRAQSKTAGGFRVIDSRHDEHRFAGAQWSYAIGGGQLSVWRDDRVFHRFNLDALRSVRPL